ncbi:MAG: DinB family protein [Pyrinomonadaceae bacterium]
MNDQLNDLTGELEEISQNAQKTFGNLSAEQINWRPSADGWSVGQCFEHLIKTNELFYAELDKIAERHKKKFVLGKLVAAFHVRRKIFD